MRIDEQLYLELPVDRADGTKIYVHAAPLGRDAFDHYWLPLSKTFAAIYQHGLGIVAGPRIAARMLKQIAGDMGIWDGPMGIERGLMEEIRRLANVVAPGSGPVSTQRGWQLVPYADAVRDGIIDEEDRDEVEGVLVFFTCVWRLHRRSERREVAEHAVRLWAASITSLSLSAYASSLPTSSEIANSGATLPVPSSPPFSIGERAPAMPNASPSGLAGTFPGAPQRSFASGTS